jgi:hypothetical protein
MLAIYVPDELNLQTVMIIQNWTGPFTLRSPILQIYNPPCQRVLVDLQRTIIAVV